MADVKERISFGSKDQFSQVFITLGSVKARESTVLIIGFSIPPSQFMYSKKIGRKVDLFYEQWAWHLEDVGNTKKASAVLAKGISNEASRGGGGGGGGRLEKLKADLEVRVVRGLSSAAEEDEENEGPSRKTLGDLRGKGKHMTAPNLRVGPQATLGPGNPRRAVSGSDANVSNTASLSRSSATSSRRPMTSSSSFNTPSTSSASGFSIFSDSNDYRDVVTDNKFTSNPVDGAVKSKENTQKAQSWNKVKAKQIVSSIRTTPLTPAFDIHVDEDDGGEDDDGGSDGVPEAGAAEDGTFFFKTPAKTPAKTINMTHARPLSTKKVDGKGPAKPLDFLEKKDEGKTEEKFMFCKDKVYQGLEEFSFEEIRFESWKKSKV